MNNFFGGPTMVRGFAPNGFGPRDLTPGTTMDNVGGSAYWATTAELQSAIPGVPNEYGLKATAFVDAGSVFRYSGSTRSRAIASGRQQECRALVGRRRPDLGLAVRRVDRRLRGTAEQGCLRRRAAAALQRGRVLTGTASSVANPYTAPAGRGIRGIAAQNSRFQRLRTQAPPLRRSAPWSCPGPAPHGPAPSRRRQVRVRRGSSRSTAWRWPSVIGSRASARHRHIPGVGSTARGPRSAFSQSFWNARPPLILRLVDLAMGMQLGERIVADRTQGDDLVAGLQCQGIIDLDRRHLARCSGRSCERGRVPWRVVRPSALHTCHS